MLEQEIKKWRESKLNGGVRWWGIVRAPGNNIVSNPEAHWVVTCEDKSCRSLFMSISSFNNHFITSQVAKNLYVVLHKGKMFVSLVVGCWRLLAAVKWNWLQRGLCKKTLLATVLANYQSNRLPVVFVKDTKSSKETVTSETQTRNRKYSPSK